jgi:non-specific serine/threonine protein kinase
VAQVLEIPEAPGRSLLATLTGALKTRRLLLVLDNCEHLLAACATLVATLLQGCPDVTLLVTSREGLGVAGEQRYGVSALAVPDPRRLPATDLVGAYEAVRLFVARAQERQPQFVLTAQNARAVAAVCARLDGLPLAIELAAARVGSLPVQAIAARLDDRFLLLTGGARTAPRRHQTLRAALAWSWDLLAAPERALLRRLAVFTGGWTLSAAEAVCAGEGLTAWEVLDGLDGLVNRSLVQVDEAAEAARYTLLETVRQFAWEQLAAAGGAAELRDRHLAYFLALAEETAPRLTGAEQRAWIERLEIEHENLRAALRWAQGRGFATALLRLAAALWRFWYLRGYLSEGRTWLESALSLAADDAVPSLAGHDVPGERRAWAMARHGAGVLAWTQGDRARATALAEKALERWRALGDTAGMAPTLNLLGLVAIDQGDWSRAAAALEESLALHRAGEDRWGIANALHNLGTVARRQGDPVCAAALYEESLALRRTLGDAAGLAISSKDRGMLAVEQGDDARAVASFRQGLTLAASLGDTVRIAECLEGLAMVAAGQGRAAPATELLAAATALRERVHAPIAPADEGDHDRLTATLRADLGAAFDATWATGHEALWERLVESTFTMF